PVGRSSHRRSSYPYKMANGSIVHPSSKLTLHWSGWVVTACRNALYRRIDTIRVIPHRSRRWRNSCVNFSKHGFTLIEVMVALTLLGLIATLVASGTRLSLDISERGNAKAETIRTEQTERGLIRSQLQGSVPLHYWAQMEDKRVEHVAFEGERDHI